MIEPFVASGSDAQRKQLTPPCNRCQWVLITGLQFGVSTSRRQRVLTAGHQGFQRIPGSTRSSTVACHRRQRVLMASLRKVSPFPRSALRDAFPGRGEYSWYPVLTGRLATLDHNHHTGNMRPSTISRHRAPRSGGPTSLWTGNRSPFLDSRKTPSLETSVSRFPFGPTQLPGHTRSRTLETLTLAVRLIVRLLFARLQQLFARPSPSSH